MPDPIRIVLDHQIKVDMTHLPVEVTMQLKDALSLDNPEREFAEQEELWGWRDMPRKLKMYEQWDDDVLAMPRGFLKDLTMGFHELGIDWTIVDRRTYPRATGAEDHGVPLRAYQAEAMRRMIYVEQGIYQAPPGSGKTVMTLAMLARLNTPAIVIVDKLNIMEQWVERCEQYLGFTPDTSYLLDDAVRGRFLTIAMQQTLNSQFKQLTERNFFTAYGAVVLDECHHASASTYFNVMHSFAAKYRFGISATPGSDPFRRSIVELVIGPVMHVTEKPALVKAGVLMKPSVYRVPTDFKFPFHPTYRDESGKLIRNNYSQMLDAISTDRDRNDLIANVLMPLAEDRRVLVVSDRIAQLEEIARRCLEQEDYAFPIYRLVGEADVETRMKITKLIERHPGMVLSTIANEALDVPALDIIALIWPSRGPDRLRQRIGRIERAYPGKPQPIILDFVDVRTRVLQSQYGARRRIYDEEKLQVSTLPRDGTMQLSLGI